MTRQEIHTSSSHQHIRSTVTSAQQMKSNQEQQPENALSDNDSIGLKIHDCRQRCPSLRRRPSQVTALAHVLMIQLQLHLHWHR